MLNCHRWLDCDVAERPLTLPHTHRFKSHARFLFLQQQSQRPLHWMWGHFLYRWTFKVSDQWQRRRGKCPTFSLTSNRGFFLLGALQVLPLKKSFICWVCRHNQGNLCRICRLETWIRVQTKQSFLPLFWLIICLPCYCRGCHSSLFSHRTVWKWNAAGQIAWLRLPQIPLHIQAPEPICAGRTDGQCEPPPPLPYNLMSLVGSRISAALFVCIQCRCLPRILSVQIFMRIPQRERTQNRESKDPK